MLEVSFPLAHVGHWHIQLLTISPLLGVAALLFIANRHERQNPKEFSPEGRRRQAERELDEILNS